MTGCAQVHIQVQMPQYCEVVSGFQARDAEGFDFFIAVHHQAIFRIAIFIML